MDKPFFIDEAGPRYDALNHIAPQAGSADFYTTGPGQHLKDATNFSLYQLHNSTSNTYHKLGEELARPDSGAEAYGIPPGTASKMHQIGSAYGQLAISHFDAAMNEPHRVLNKTQFQRTERLNGGAVNYGYGLS